MVAHYGSIGDRPANKAIIAPDQIYTQLIPTLKVTFASIILLILGFTLPKLSILILYLRIFTGRKTRLVSWITIALVAAQGVAFSVASIFACAPVEYFWNKLILDGECINLNFFYQSFGLPNIVIDAMILITPLPAIWGLQASVARRTGITFIFLTGVVAMIVSCIRWNLYSKSDVYIIQPSEFAIRHSFVKGMKSEKTNYSQSTMHLSHISTLSNVARISSQLVYQHHTRLSTRYYRGCSSLEHKRFRHNFLFTIVSDQHRPLPWADSQRRQLRKKVTLASH